MFERFTERARALAKRTLEIAAEAGAPSIEPSHLLAALLDDESLEQVNPGQQDADARVTGRRDVPAGWGP